MRITNKTLASNYLRNLNNNLRAVQKYHNQLSSGKEVSKPSDNPMLVSKIMSLKDCIKTNEQYNSNISGSIGWVQTQDTALGDISRILNRVRDLMIYGANGFLSEAGRMAIKDEVETQIGELVDVLNTNFDGRYIFSGQKTTSVPYEIKDVFNADGNQIGKTIIYKGDDKNIIREISTGVTIDLISSGREIIGYGDNPSDPADTSNELGSFLMKVLDAFDNEPIKLSEELLGELDRQLDRVLKVRSKIGAVDNRLQAAEARNISENINLKGLLSGREDIDVAEKYMEYSIMAVVYQASLITGAKILQPSLLDYLR